LPCGACVAAAAAGAVGFYIGTEFYRYNDVRILDTIDSMIMMASRGNQVDTQIASDYGRAVSAARLKNCPPPDRCDWLRENAKNYRPDQVKATEKAWGCRGSRFGKGGKSR
jgi:hypothetical protein